ncbi:MAG: hypothetical protein Q7J06_12890, partial [Bacteroidales bacterium]|nr:hypothetical protein [Bacteroidales bacterium]
VIDNSGNVGIGTTSPSAKLDIKDTTSGSASGQNILTLQSNYAAATVGSGGRIVFKYQGGTQETADIRGYTFGSGATGLAFGTGWDAVTPKMVIDNSGNVGIGTTGPGYKLEVAGTGKFRDATYFGNASTNKGLISWGTGTFVINATSGNDLQFGSNGTSAQMVLKAGNVGIGTTTIRVPAYTKLDVEGGDIYIDDFSGTDDKFAATVGYVKSTSGASVTGEPNYIPKYGADGLLTETTTPIYELNDYIGIGTTVPAAVLDVAGQIRVGAYSGDANAVPKAYIDDNFLPIAGGEPGGTGDAFIQGGNSFGALATLGTNDNYDLTFETNNSRKMTIETSGNVGIGTTDPDAKLDVRSDVASYPAIYASSSVYDGVQGISTASGRYGIQGVSDTGAARGVYGLTGSSTGAGVYGENTNGTSGYGVYGLSNAGIAIYGSTTSGYAGIFMGGNVGIGTTAPQGTLHISSDTYAHNLIINQSANTNLTPNPSIEVNTSNWGCWHNSGSGSCVSSTDTAAFGSKSWKSTMTVDGNQGNVIGATNVSASTTYSVSAWVNITSWGGSNFTFYVREYYPTGSSQCGSTLYTASGVTNGWIRITGTCTTRADTTSLSVSYYLGSTSQVVYTDGVQIEQASAVSPYSDGSLGPGYAWSGTPHASSTTRTTGSNLAYYSINSANGLGAASRGTSPTLRIEQDGTGPIASFLTPSSEVVRIDNTGNVGIGTTVPGYKLDVRGAVAVGTAGATNQIHFLATPTIGTDAANRAYVDDNFLPIAGGEPGGTGDAFIQGGNSFGALATLGTNDNYDLTFETNNSRKMTILTGGNVGIGTTAPASKLDILGVEIAGGTFTGTTPGIVRIGGGAFNVDDIIALDFGSSSQGAGTAPLARVGTQLTATGSFLHFGTSNNFNLGVANTALTINPTGNVGIGTTSPLAKLHIETDLSTTSLTGLTKGIIHLNAGVDAASKDITAITFSTNDNRVGSIIGSQTSTIGNSLFFGTSNAFSSGVTNTAMFISPTGNVAIGTTSAGYRLDVLSPDAIDSYMRVQRYDGDVASGIMLSTGASTPLWTMYVDGG